MTLGERLGLEKEGQLRFWCRKNSLREHAQDLKVQTGVKENKMRENGEN